MTIRTETNTLRRSVIGWVRHIASELQRSAERSVAIQYDQPWKSCRS